MSGSKVMDVLYLHSDTIGAFGAPLLAKKKFDRLYTDSSQETHALKDCLQSLTQGDTLYVERESVLAESMVSAARVLKHLADLGVNVWCERSQKMISADCSPFKDVSLDAAQAVIDFRNIFSRMRQESGLKRARRAGTKFGRKKVALPDCFTDVCYEWFERKISVYQAAAKCELSVSTFWKHAKELQKRENPTPATLADLAKIFS